MIELGNQPTVPLCPACRQAPIADIKVLRTNSAVLALLQSLEENQAKASKTTKWPFPNPNSPPQCDDCEKNTVATHCEDCKVSRCDECSADTHKRKTFKDHKIVPWTPAVGARVVITCKPHDEKLKLFCQSCQVCIE